MYIYHAVGYMQTIGYWTFFKNHCEVKNTTFTIIFQDFKSTHAHVYVHMYVVATPLRLGSTCIICIIRQLLLSLSFIIQEGQVNINQRTGHSLDAYAFGVFVSDILDTRADLGNILNLSSF